ncbi:hypothetical protein NKDENANG_01615 [Candidatus Entotheonellaceae bacterium PAL068K]
MIVADDTQRIGRDSEVTFVSLPSDKAIHLVPTLLEPSTTSASVPRVMVKALL